MPAVLLHDVPEPISPHHAAGVENRAASNVDVVVNRDIRMQNAPFTENDALSQYAPRADAGGHPDARAIADSGVGANINHSTDFDSSANYRGGVDSRLEFDSGIKAAHGTRERRARLLYPDELYLTDTVEEISALIRRFRASFYYAWGSGRLPREVERAWLSKQGLASDGS